MHMILSISRAELARSLGISQQAIFKWDRVPADRVLDVARATGWRDTPHMLRPDMYPHPDDGLPPERRTHRDAHTA